MHSTLTVNYPEDYLPYATSKRKKQPTNSSEISLNNNESENMNKQRTNRQKSNNTLNGNVIESNLPYFTWDDLSQRTDQHQTNRSSLNQRTTENNLSNKNRIDLSSDETLLTGTSNSPTAMLSSRGVENHCTKNQINNNNFNSNLSANFGNFHADRELEEEVELFENNQTELREHDEDDFEVEDDDNLNDDEILAGYTRNGTLQSNNYLHNATLGHRLLMMNQSVHNTTSLQQQLQDANNRTGTIDDSSGGITNQAFIGLHSCYGYPKCENGENCLNCGKAHLTNNLGDHINASNSSWFSVTNDSRNAICSLGCCAILTTCLFILLAIISVVGISIYLSNITNQNKSNVLPLSGRFKVQSGDLFTENLFNTSSKEFQMKATKYEAIVSLIFCFCFVLTIFR